MIVESQEKLSDIAPSIENKVSNMLENEVELASIDNKMKYLVADTAAFIKNIPMHEYAHNIISIKDVVDEIRDKATRERLLACPIEIQYKEPDSQSYKKVTDFSKKSGDFGALSATDVKVLALTYMLEAATVGTEHLKETPTIKRTTEFYNPKDNAKQHDTVSSKVPGFYMPEGEEEEESENDTEDDNNDENKELCTNSNLEGTKDDCNVLVETLKKSDLHSEVEHVEADNDVGSYESNEDDDEGWITPGNYIKKKEEMETANEEELSLPVEVACMTSDFAMQNVLLSMGLHVISPTGQLIKETKTWILRCYACFKTTPHIEKKFCPNCGNKTLKRVSVTLNADGTQQIHISTRRPLIKKGKKFSLPKPVGGKHAVNPILCEDQQFARQHTTKMARAKNNPLQPDFIAGNAPFMKNDVTSRSAMLGVGNTTRQYWLHKNPNAVGKNTGNRKKKKDR